MTLAVRKPKDSLTAEGSATRKRAYSFFVCVRKREGVVVLHELLENPFFNY